MEDEEKTMKVNESTEKELTGYPSIDRPWLKYYSEEALNAKVPECSMYQYIVEKNRNNKDQTAIRYYGRKINYGQLFQKIIETARSFKAWGIKEGDTVTLMSLDTPETLYCIYALNYLGAVINSVYISLTPSEIKKTVCETASKMLIVLDIVSDKLTEVAEELENKQILMLHFDTSMPLTSRMVFHLMRKEKRGGYTEWNTFLKAGKNEEIIPIYKKDAPAVIVYTSGTTGEPKGVVLSNENINAVALQYEVSGQEFERGDTFLTYAPPFMAVGISINIHMPFALGLTEELSADPSPENVNKVYVKKRPNHFLGAPMNILLIQKTIKGKMDFCKTIAAGGELLGNEETKRLNEFLRKKQSNARYVTGYGMSEFAATVSTETEFAYKLGSIGIPLCLATAKVVDTETETELKYGEVGELCFTSPSMMLGYLNNKLATDEVCHTHRDGKKWIHTGDLGYIDEDGFIFFTGRMKRIFLTRCADGIICKIFPARVEKLVESVNGVKKCAVAVEEDKEILHRQIAYIVLEEDAKQEKVLKEVRDVCEENLPMQSIPCRYELLDKLPLTVSGKTDYGKLEGRKR